MTNRFIRRIALGARHPGSVAVFAALMSILCACYTRESRALDSASHVQPSAEPSTDSMPALQLALDSCQAAGRAAPAGAQHVTPDAVLRGTVHNFRMFSLVVPDSAQITVSDTLLGGVTLTWPRCADCTFALSVRADSGIDLEQRIARIVAEQRRIDSVNRDPQAVAGEFNEIDGPPEPFTTLTGKGYLIDNDCGDCAARTLLFGRPGYIAALSFGGDDNVPELGRHLCEMTAIGKTFTWRQ